MKIVAIMQARMGSTRLPGKVMKKICGKTVLEHDIERLRKVSNIHEIVIATTTKPSDDEIEKEAKRLGVSVFRGSEDNVLERYYLAAKVHNADVVVRITSDCPLIDADVTEFVIATYLDNVYRNKYDYVSNTLERSYPRGFDTEVFSIKALSRAYREATLERDLEHVTPYIWSNPNIFSIYSVKKNIDLSHIRLTLDTEEDFEFITKIYEELYNGKYFSFSNIMSLLEKKPYLIEINKDIEQKHI